MRLVDVDEMTGKTIDQPKQSSFDPSKLHLVDVDEATLMKDGKAESKDSPWMDMLGIKTDAQNQFGPTPEPFTPVANPFDPVPSKGGMVAGNVGAAAERPGSALRFLGQTLGSELGPIGGVAGAMGGEAVRQGIAPVLEQVYKNFGKDLGIENNDPAKGYKDTAINAAISEAIGLGLKKMVPMIARKSGDTAADLMNVKKTDAGYDPDYNQEIAQSGDLIGWGRQNVANQAANRVKVINQAIDDIIKKDDRMVNVYGEDSQGNNPVMDRFDSAIDDASTAHGQDSPNVARLYRELGITDELPARKNTGGNPKEVLASVGQEAKKKIYAATPENSFTAEDAAQKNLGQRIRAYGLKKAIENAYPEEDIAGMNKNMGRNIDIRDAMSEPQKGGSISKLVERIVEGGKFLSGGVKSGVETTAMIGLLRKLLYPLQSVGVSVGSNLPNIQGSFKYGPAFVNAAIQSAQDKLKG